MHLIGLALCCLLVAGSESETGNEAEANLAHHFGFGEMQIYKFKPGIGLLHLADLDADGKTDILLYNPSRSRFELVYQREDGADTSDESLDQNEIPNRGPMRIETAPVMHRVVAVSVAELTGDQRPDIVYFGEPKELVILPGKKGGGFGPAIRIRAPEGLTRGGVLAIGDFNHDRRQDVALMADGALLVFQQKSEGGLSKPRRYAHGIESPTLMFAGDFNGDDRDDLIIGADEEQRGAYVCLQSKSGTLGALRPVQIPRLRSMTIAPPTKPESGHTVYGIEYTTGRLKQFDWTAPVGGAQRDWPQRWHSYAVDSDSKQRPFAIGDVDGDGLTDCVVADPEAAQIMLYRGRDTGLEVAKSYPGLMQVTDIAVADLDGNGRCEVLLASADEKMIGVSRFDDGRLEFPTALLSNIEPEVLAVGSLKAGSKPNTLAMVTSDEDRRLVVMGRIDSKKPDERQSIEIEELDDDPAGLMFVDANQDGRNDLLLVLRFEPPRLYVQDSSGKFERFSGAETRDWLLKEVTPANIAVADVNGDGKAELLMAWENLARSLVVRDGHWEIVDQYNPDTADASILGLTVLDRDDRAPMLVMYDRRGDELIVFEQQLDHTFAVTQSMPVGRFNLKTMMPLPIGKDAQRAVLLADSERLAVISPQADAATLTVQQSYETEEKEAWLGDTTIGDVNGDGQRDVVAVDMGKASLEVLTTLSSGKIAKALRFQVFEGKRFTDAPDMMGEPREVLVADVTGDKRDDIVLIVHDRLIVYPGQ